MEVVIIVLRSLTINVTNKQKLASLLLIYTLCDSYAIISLPSCDGLILPTYTIILLAPILSSDDVQVYNLKAALTIRETCIITTDF